MAQIGKFVRLVTLAGEPVTINQWTITPLAQSLTIRWLRGGFVWNRPVALLVARNGTTERIPLPDITRNVQIVLLGVVLLSLLLFSGSDKEKTR